jgi:hypothetical protein
MPGISININTDAFAAHANRLDRISEKLLPNVVRFTLSDTAKDAKKKYIPKTSSLKFTRRESNFFNAFTGVDFPKRGPVNQMESRVGFFNNTKEPYNKTKSPVKSLEAMESGGMIPFKRSMIPVPNARTSKSMSKRVAKKNIISQLPTARIVKQAPGKTRGEKFIRSAIDAGVGGYLITQKSMMRITKLSKVGNKTSVKTEILYHYQSGRRVRVPATHFMRTATTFAARKMADMFYNKTEKEIQRYWAK